MLKVRSRLVLAALFLVEALFCYACIQQRFPISGDDYSYLYQAELFAGGRLYAEGPLYDAAHPLHACVAVNCLRDDAGRRFSKYAPGWPLLLAGGVALGVPWLVGPLLGAGLVYLMLSHLARTGGADVARRAWVLTMSCVFLAYYAASYRAHVAAALFVFGAFVVHEQTRDRPDAGSGPGRWRLVVAGALLGGTALIRYLDWVPLGLWIGVPLLRKRRLTDLIVFAGAFATVASGNLVYNALIAGNPFTAPTNVPAGEGLHDQLQLSWDGFRVTAARLALLAWVFPPAVLLALRTVRLGPRGRAYLSLFGMQVALYFLYPTAIAGPGPRYLLPYLPFLILAVAELDGRMRVESPRRSQQVWRWMVAGQLAASVVFAAREAHTLYWRRDVERTLAAVERGDTGKRIVLLRTGTYRTDRADLVRNPRDLSAAETLLIGGCDDDARVDALREAFPGRDVLVYEYPGGLTPRRGATTAGAVP